MQSHCVDTLGATCALVVVFPDTTNSGNPDNCGNACSCTKSVRRPGDVPRHLSFFPIVWERQTLTVKKQCPAVPFRCADSQCGGDQFRGCTYLGNDGCPCTGVPSKYEVPVVQAEPQPFGPGTRSCPRSLPCGDAACEGSFPHGNDGICNSGYYQGCSCSP